MGGRGLRLRLRLCRRLGLGRGCCWLLYPEIAEKVIEIRKKILEKELEVLQSLLNKSKTNEKKQE